MAAVQSKPDVPVAPPSAPAPSAAPTRSASSRKLPRPGTFSHTRLPRTPSVPRGRSYHGKPLSAAAQAAQQGYFARKAAKMYAERKKAEAAAAATAAATTSAPSPEGDVSAQAEVTAALKPANRNEQAVDVINITVDAQGVKIDENKSRVCAMAPRNNSRARMTRSSSRQRNMHNRSEDKENFITDARLDAHIEAYFTRKRAVVAAVAAQPVDARLTEHSSTSNHSWDGSMPRRRNSRSVIERDHAISQRVSPSLNAKPSTTAISAREGALDQSCNLKQCANEQSKQSNDTAGGSAVTSSAQNSCGELPSTGKWCDECAGVGRHISALLSELQTQRPVPEAGAADMSSSSSGSGSKKGWKSMVTQTVLGDSKSKSSSEKAKLQQEINVLRATVDFLYKKIERLETNDSTSATSASSR
eukprot:TRINITY_DN20488_c0_g1_i1.p1 TRINITY_DN20488_c0_g1~~TRINITY_DN20488_c0_g1_i1.p1  ORF type:complete len:438 (-),score=99.87 TRINITY_DN20488_c0_g1_i1:942-2192(-)